MTKYKHFTEKDLYAAAQLSKYKDLSMIPPASELKGRHTFSEAFEKKISEIYKIFDQPKRKSKIVYKVLLVAAIITLLFALAMSASAICERVYELFLTHYDNHANGSFVSIQQDDGSYIEVRGDLSALYYPSYIPDGFKLADNYTEENILNITTYKNDIGETITYKQEIIFAHLDIDTEGTDITEVIDNDIIFYCSQKDGFSTVIWTQNGYAFHLICKLSMDEAMKIAKSLLAE